jgi:microcystin-dependent protein
MNNNPQPLPFLGQVTCFAGTYAPQGWVFCEGQILPIAPSGALFSLVGTMYGGDGRVNFALPDLRDSEPKQKESGYTGPRYIICVGGDYPKRP